MLPLPSFFFTCDSGNFDLSHFLNLLSGPYSFQSLGQRCVWNASWCQCCSFSIFCVLVMEHSCGREGCFTDTRAALCLVCATFVPYYTICAHCNGIYLYQDFSCPVSWLWSVISQFVPEARGRTAHVLFVCSPSLFLSLSLSFSRSLCLTFVSCLFSIVLLLTKGNLQNRAAEKQDRHQTTWRILVLFYTVKPDPWPLVMWSRPWGKIWVWECFTNTYFLRVISNSVWGREEWVDRIEQSDFEWMLLHS